MKKSVKWTLLFLGIILTAVLFYLQIVPDSSWRAKGYKGDIQRELEIINQAENKDLQNPK